MKNNSVLFEGIKDKEKYLKKKENKKYKIKKITYQKKITTTRYFPPKANNRDAITAFYD